MSWLTSLSGELAGVPLTTLLAVAVGVLVLVARVARLGTFSTPTAARTSRALAVRQPGWLTRRRAASGIQHGPERVGVGYERAIFGTVHLTLAELNHHGYLGGATGSGKTTLMRDLVEGFPGPVIALDCKGDQALAETVWSLPGIVWEIGGPLKLDLLDPEPAILAQQLLEGEAFGDRGAVYRAIAEHAIIRAGQVLRWRSEPLELPRILELVSSPATLAEAIREAMPAEDRTAQRWLVELDAASTTIREGFQTFVERLGSLLDSPAGRSLGTGPEAVRLADVLASRSKLLIRLDPRYGAISRKVGAWTLIAMLRLAAELRQAAWQGRCLFIVDDPRLLKHEGRWLADLFGTARDAGIGLVVADQGIAGLAEIDPTLPDTVLRSTGWQLIFRQGSDADAEKMAALFGTTWREDVSYSSDGRTTTRLREEPAVYPTWLKDLPTGHAWFHGAPIGLTARSRRALLVVAAPAPPDKRARLALPPGRPPAPAAPAPEAAAAPAGPPPTVEDLARRAVLRLVGPLRQDGCREWLGSYDGDGYGRAAYHGHQPQAHRLLARWEYGPIPSSWEVDHTCRHRWCVEITHLDPIPRGEHRRREAERRRHLADEAAEMADVADMADADEQAPAAPGVPAAAPQAAPGVSTVEQRRAAVQQLRAQGWSLRRIAEHLGISYGTAQSAARETINAHNGGDQRGDQPDHVDQADHGPHAPTSAVSELRSDNGVVRRSGGSTRAVVGEPPSLADTAEPARTGFAIALFAGVDRPRVEPRTLSLEDLVDLLSTYDVLDDKRQGRCWSPTRYADGAPSRHNDGVEAVSCLVFDCDRVEPDWARLAGSWYVAHTTYQHTPEHPRWRLVLPLAAPVAAPQWRDVWRRAHSALCPEADPNCKDPSRQYYLPGHPPGVLPQARCHEGPLLDAATLPELPPEPKRQPGRPLLAPTATPREPTQRERRQAATYMRKVITGLETTPAGGRNDALNHAAWTLGHWVAAGALEQTEVEEALFAAAERNGLVSDPKDGPRKTWATIRSGLSKGLQQPIDLDAEDRRPPSPRRRRSV